MSLATAVKWSFLAELASKAVQPVVFVVLARLLSPEDFGVMTAAMMVIGFSQLFWEAGMGKAVIQRQGDIQDAASAAFWINVGLACAVGIALFSAAPIIAEVVFGDQRVSPVLRVMVCHVMLGAVSAVHVALLQKAMLFQKLFWVRFATVSLPGIASIPLAWMGLGYWALVSGAVVGQAVQAALLWRLNPWRPILLFDWKVARQVARFGMWVALTGLTAWFYAWGDSLFVGLYLSSHDLGLYRAGNQFSVMVFSILFGPAVPVLYSYLSRMSTDLARLRSAANLIVRGMIILAIPIGMVLFSLANLVEDVIFGKNWQGLGLIIGIMGLTHGFAWVVGMNGEFYRAMGNPKIETLVPAATLIIYLAGYLVSIQYGLEAFLWTRFGLAMFGVLLHLYVVDRLLNLRFFPIIGYLATIALMSSGIIIALREFLSSFLGNTWIGLISMGIVNMVIIGLCIYLLERKRLVMELFVILRNKSTA